MKKRIAFFDFDGTITTKDTLLEFIKFCKGKIRFYAGFLLHSHYLVAYKLKIISNQKAKEKILTYFFQNIPLPEFQNYCEQFGQQVLPGLIRPQALREIEKFHKAGVTVVIVSASPENWISGWARSLKLSLIATQLEINNEQLTGKIKGFNCHGQEKVRRIKETYDLSAYAEIYAYGDTSGDKPMLALAQYAYMRPFQ